MKHIQKYTFAFLMMALTCSPSLRADITVEWSKICATSRGNPLIVTTITGETVEGYCEEVNGVEIALRNCGVGSGRQPLLLVGGWCGFVETRPRDHGQVGSQQTPERQATSNFFGNQPMIRTLVGMALCASGAVYGQTAAPARFEVASIRPSKADPSSSGMNTGPGGLNAINVTVKRCIMGAYGVGPNQISGGPEWLDSDRFDITAKGDQPVGDHALMGMLQTLLAERFKLVLHRDAKPIQAYVLEVGKNGSKLEKGDGLGAKTNNGRGNIVATNATMDRFAEVLSRQTDLPVVNHTALDGVFNIKLQWTPDNARLAKSADGTTVEGPSIFTAVQEQLGLRLRSQRISIEVLVIDHLEKPSEN